MEVKNFFHGPPKYTSIHLGIFCIVSVAMGILGTRLWWRNHAPQGVTNSLSVVRETDNAYHYIHPLLFCDNSSNREFQEVQSLKSDVQSRIANEEGANTSADTVSVYFRDLDKGSWFGINENEKYSPASLLKVPTLLAFLRIAEQDPSVLKKVVEYDDGINENALENFKPAQAIQPGQRYTVEELLHFMIIYSDNNARRMLHDIVDPRILAEVYTDLGLSIPTTNAEVDFMSVKNYSYFFRTLYNATYLNREMSEKAMQLLINAEFPKGIERGVPSAVAVANKFGERTEFAKDGVTVTARELHECGIIFYPEHPYLLCVMTRGKNFDHLAAIISGISATVYHGIDETYKK